MNKNSRVIMSNFKDWLKKENIHLNLSAESELEALWTMFELASEKSSVINRKLLAQSVYENEVLRPSHRGSSGVTFYALTDAVTRPLMVIGHFENGFGYYSKQNKPVDLVVLLAAPEHSKNELRNMIGYVKDMLCDCAFLEILRKTNNPTMIYHHLHQYQLEFHIKNHQNSDPYLNPGN